MLEPRNALFKDTSTSTHKTQLYFFLLLINIWMLKSKIKYHLQLLGKKKKKLCVILTKHGQDLYDENYKTPMIEFGETLNEWQDIMCPWIGKHSIIKIPVLSRCIYWLHVNSTKIPGGFCVCVCVWIYTKIRIKILKFIWKGKGTGGVETLLRKKNKSGRVSLSNFKIYYLAAVIKTLWYW